MSRPRLKSSCAREKVLDYPGVAEEYRVIGSDTRMVLVDQQLIKRLQEGEKISWQYVQAKSVQMWKNKIDKLELPQVGEIYVWNRPYDPDLLGYMADMDTVRLSH